jgi:hypothetical protein
MTLEVKDCQDILSIVEEEEGLCSWCGRGTFMLAIMQGRSGRVLTQFFSSRRGDEFLWEKSCETFCLVLFCSISCMGVFSLSSAVHFFQSDTRKEVFWQCLSFLPIGLMGYLAFALIGKYHLFVHCKQFMLVMAGV